MKWLVAHWSHLNDSFAFCPNILGGGRDSFIGSFNVIATVKHILPETWCMTQFCKISPTWAHPGWYNLYLRIISCHYMNAGIQWWRRSSPSIYWRIYLNISNSKLIVMELWWALTPQAQLLALLKIIRHMNLIESSTFSFQVCMFLFFLLSGSWGSRFVRWVLINNDRRICVVHCHHNSLIAENNRFVTGEVDLHVSKTCQRLRTVVWNTDYVHGKAPTFEKSIHEHETALLQIRSTCHYIMRLEQIWSSL